MECAIPVVLVTLIIQLWTQVTLGDAQNDKSAQDVVVVNKDEEGKKVTNIPGCTKYSYCQGEKFPATIMIGEHRIRCARKPKIRNKCCLTQAPHMVCYDIKVNGQLLTYDMGDPVQGTDFTDICKLLVESQNKTLGQYTSMLPSVGGGELRYRYQEWDYVQDSDQHVKHIACEVTDLNLGIPTPKPKKKSSSEEDDNDRK